MASYLLLRNNKESGPYTVDGLMELGLKPYDLVWVQGRSAAWRYPSEVDELKPIAPVIEEQPYDRFYKKQGDEVQSAVVQPAVGSQLPIAIGTAIVQPAVSGQLPIAMGTVKEQPAVIQQAQPEIKKVQQETPPIAPEHEKYIPKKSVFVTMPGQKTVTAQAPVPVPMQQQEKPVARQERYMPPAPEPVPVQQTITISENPAAAQIKYSQPLDEIKEMYVKTLHERKQKIARKSFWLQSLKKAAALLSLVAVGLIAGFILKSNGNKQAGVSQTDSQPMQSLNQKAVNLSDTTIPSGQASTDPPEEDEPIVPSNNRGTTVHMDFKGSEEVVERKQPVTLKQSTETPANNPVKKEDPEPVYEYDVSSSEEPKGVDIDPSTGERSRKVRNSNDRDKNVPTGDKNKKEEIKTTHSVSGNIARLVSVESNEYKKVAFGGIRDLHLTVNNDSKYTLDDVIVELTYLKPSEQPLWTANILFKSIGPKNSSTLRIPDTNRGIKVKYKIIHIKSREMDGGVAGN